MAIDESVGTTNQQFYPEGDVSVHCILKKDQILTIPNFLSLVRLALIPIIVWLYCEQQNYRGAVAVIVLSGLTDIADGIIARKFNMVSDFGKILDPIADKLTQAVLLVCLTARYRMMLLLIVFFAFKELFTLYMGYLALKENRITSAQWYGKLNTVTLYTIVIVLILFPEIPVLAANCLILLGVGTSVLAAVLYARFYRLHGSKKSNAAEKITKRSH